MMRLGLSVSNILEILYFPSFKNHPALFCYSTNINVTVGICFGALQSGTVNVEIA